MNEMERGFDELYRRYYSPVRSYTRRRTVNAEDAEDIVAITFMTAWRRYHDVHELDRPLPWLFGVAHRTLANHRRSTRRAAELLHRASSDVAAAGLVVDPEARETVYAVFDALDSLPERDQRLLLLTAHAELRPTEVAEVLQRKPSAVRSDLYRARQRLRRVLGDDQA